MSPPSPTRFAHIYVFAFHPGVDDGADHRDPKQWEFYVLRTTELPDRKALSLSDIRSRARPLAVTSLAEEVEAAREAVKTGT